MRGNRATGQPGAWQGSRFAGCGAVQASLMLGRTEVMCGRVEGVHSEGWHTHTFPFSVCLSTPLVSVCVCMCVCAHALKVHGTAAEVVPQHHF